VLVLDRHQTGTSSGKPKSEPDGQPSDIPSMIRPLPKGVLAARYEVVRYGRRRRRLLERLAKPAYVNTDASSRNGLAGLAYSSHALGTRTELVVCDDIVKAEHMALLMAMEDAERVLVGRIEFRVDSTAVITYAAGKSPNLRAVRKRTDIFLARHPEWRLALVPRTSNMRANALARVPFKQLGEGGAGPQTELLSSEAQE
jgi:hypothetical protein